jgi:hypothetical protein
MEIFKNITSRIWRFLNNYSLLIILPLSFIFFGLNKYPHLISFSAIIDTFLFSFFTLLIFYLVPKFKFSHFQSILIASYLGVIFLFYRDIIKLIILIPYLDILDYSPVNIVSFLLLSFFLINLIIRSSENKIQLIYKYIKSFILLFFTINICVWTGLNSFKPSIDIEIKDIEFSKAELKETPDVHCILLDEYCGFKSMEYYHHYQNLDFKNKLKRLSFFVAQNPSSNYNFTWMSCPSLLEMNYIDTSALKGLKNNDIYINGAEVIFKNNIFNFFNSRGYNTINNSFFKIKSDFYNNDVTIDINKKTITENTLLEYSKKSFLNHIPFNKIQSFLQTKMGAHYNYNESVLNYFYSTLNKDLNKPSFIYTHLLIPHPPYLSTEKNIRNFREAYMITGSKQSEYYLEYIKYANQLVIKMVNAILKKNKNSIIIITSDHGDRFSINKIKELDFNNFFAVYTPDQNYNGFSDSINTVNIFRTLLNNQFKQSLPLLESGRRFSISK